MSTKIEDLTPNAQEKFQLLHNWLTANNITHVVLFTRRTDAEQIALYSKVVSPSTP